MMRLWVAALVLVAAGTQVIVRTPPAPSISSLSVTSGPVGTTVVLTGVHFGTTQGSGTVVFQSATLASPTAWTDISITVTVPVGAVTGSVVVVQNGVTSNPITFTVSASGTAQTCTANTYYVRTDGSNANTGLANTAGGAWLTITKGVQTAVAGDCIRVQPGTYGETITPTHSGSAGNTITVVADGAVTACGATFTGQNYLRLIGVTLNRAGVGCGSSAIVGFTGTNTGDEFWNDDIGHLNGNGVVCDQNGGAECDKLIWIGDTIHDIGNPSTSQAITADGNDSYYGYLTFTNVCYLGIIHSGSRVRVINPYFQSLISCGGHPDFFYFHNTAFPYSNGVIEAMWGVGTPTDSNNKIDNAELCHFAGCGGSGAVVPDWNDNLIRFSVTYNMGSASYQSMGTDSGAGNINRWRQYNNTHVLGDRAVSGAQFNGCGGVGANGGVITLYVINSIFYECWAAGNTSVDPIAGNTPPTFTDYNLAFDHTTSLTFSSRWTGQAHPQSNVDPVFTNVATPDVTLQATSGARGTGGPVTTAVSCSGTALTVAANTGSYVIGDNSANLAAYGGKLVPGDTITLDGTTVLVNSVAGDVVTLGSSLTCSLGDAVYYGSGTPVDIGAFPYKAGGYTLSATKSCSGATCTVTPNDASLVRFVVCYENSVPYAVVNTSPFTCNNPSGTFQARVYPRYASTTLWVVAP